MSVRMQTRTRNRKGAAKIKISLTVSERFKNQERMRGLLSRVQGAVVLEPFHDLLEMLAGDAAVRGRMRDIAAVCRKLALDLAEREFVQDLRLCLAMLEVTSVI